MQKNILPVSLTLLILSSSVAQAFQYEKNVPEEYSRQIELDLRNFEKMDFDRTDTERRRVLFGLSHAPTMTSLRSWLEERAKIIVPQDWDPFKSKVAERNGIWPDVNPKHIPSPNKEPKKGPQEDPNKSAVVVMSNFGAAIYDFSKLNGTVYTFALEGLSRFEITSPRVGLLQIGEGLFHPFFTVNSENPESIANSINRLSTFFHEARHSDGHGKSLTFSHAICPSGHGYAGLYACDTNLNGPYTIGAEINKMMLESCSTCTGSETEILRLRALDSMSRVLVSYDDFPTPGEVETMKITSGNCFTLAKMMQTITSECRKELSQMVRIIKEGVIQRTAMDLDPTPEKMGK